MEHRASDSLGRYYTQEAIASLLIDAMGVHEPKTVVDLGAGSGILVHQAAKHWKSARFLTVDIDGGADSSKLPALHGSAFSHFTVDALDFRLNERLGVRWGRACAAVCNPPYIRPRWQKHFGQILERVGLSHILPEAKDAPADILFIAQNLRLLRSGGKLGLIVPDGLISGERYASFRRSLMGRHRVEHVIELPRNIFRKTEAQAHILVVTKGVPTAQIISRKLGDDGTLSDPVSLHAAEGALRLDYTYHAGKRSQGRGLKSSGVQLSSLVASIKRGSFSSSDRRQVSAPVFHTTDFRQGDLVVPQPFVLSMRAAANVGGNFAKAGDIVLARVGRNLSCKIALVSRGAVLVSDCVWILEPMPGQQKLLLEKLTSSEGRSSLEASAHGVGARFITAKSLLQLRL